MIDCSSLRGPLSAAATAVGTAALTLGLLGGVPYVLWAAAGVPWPERVSSWAQLTQRLAQPISDPLMTDLLALVGWACWAAFTASVIREVCWYTAHLPQLLRDQRTHREHLATLSWKGSLAALCVGTLVVALLTLWRPSQATAQPLHAAAQLPPAATLNLPQQPVRPLTAAGELDSRHEKNADASPAPVDYTVQAGDTLWDIAHRHLGDAVKWPRIYALNKDRLQPDGGRLTDPEKITPGWRLSISTTSAETHESAKPTPPASPKSPTPHASSSPDSTPSPPHPTPPAHAGPDDETGQTTNAAAKTRGTATVSLGEAGVIGVTAAAGLLAALHFYRFYRRRRHYSAPTHEPPDLSPVVEKAVWAGREATLDRTAPAPDALVTRRLAPQQPHPAGTVTIGTRDDVEVPLSALPFDRGCTWSGPGAESAARALLTGILTAAERQRPKPPLVTVTAPRELTQQLLPGLPRQLPALHQAGDQAEAIRSAEKHLLAHTRHQQPDHEPDSEEAYADTTDNNAPGLMMLLAIPEPSRVDQLQALAARSHPDRLLVLTLGAPLPEGTAWHIAPDGSVTAPESPPQTPGHLRLFLLTPQAAQDVLAVILGAHDLSPEEPTSALPATDSTSPPLEEENPPDDIPAQSQSPPPTEPRPPQPEQEQRKPVHLQVLGPVTVYAGDKATPVGANLRPEVREFLALLASRPHGMSAADIARNLRLDGDSDHIARELKNLRRAVRRTLRTATALSHAEFVQLHGEFHKLAPQLVETDLAAFQDELKTAANEANRGQRFTAFRKALQHYRGPFAQGGDYPWADGLREHLTVQATDAVISLARHAEEADETARAGEETLALLEQFITLHPDTEQLYERAIRLHQAAGRHDAAQRTYSRLKDRLAELGLQPDPAIAVLLTSHARAATT